MRGIEQDRDAGQLDTHRVNAPPIQQHSSHLGLDHRELSDNRIAKDYYDS